MFVQTEVCGVCADCGVWCLCRLRCVVFVQTEVCGVYADHCTEVCGVCAD